MDSSGKVIWARHNEVRRSKDGSRPWILILLDFEKTGVPRYLCFSYPFNSSLLLPPQVQTVNIKSLGADYERVDGERLQLAVKDLGSSDLYPQV